MGSWLSVSFGFIRTPGTLGGHRETIEKLLDVHDHGGADGRAFSVPFLLVETVPRGLIRRSLDVIANAGLVDLNWLPLLNGGFGPARFAMSLFPM